MSGVGEVTAPDIPKRSLIFNVALLRFYSQGNVPASCLWLLSNLTISMLFIVFVVFLKCLKLIKKKKRNYRMLNRSPGKWRGYSDWSCDKKIDYNELEVE